MENIYEPDDTFPFNQLQFISPTAVAGGNYFIRCLTGKQKPLYIQPPKCSCKSGLVKTGKRMYIDLVFQHDDEQFIEWVEKLENLCQTKIFDNRSKWFESGLEMHDIENSFTPTMKIYKSGKMYVVRANIPLRLGKCGLKIYDEQENDVNPEAVTDKMPLMTILEIQGIKCSSRSFQIEIEVKQMMTLNPTADIFESCLFSKGPAKKSEMTSAPIPETVIKTTESMTESAVETPVETPVETTMIQEESPSFVLETVEDNETTSHHDPLLDTTTEVDTEEIDLGDLVKNDPLEEDVSHDILKPVLEDAIPEREIQEVSIPVEGVSPEEGFCEIDFPLDKSDNDQGDVMQLKNRNEVYYEMYQNAKRKAKIARDIALSSYLEAKQIKNTYLIHEDVEDEDDEEKNEEELRNIEKTIESA